MRTEEEIFKDLAGLCVSEGYIHVVAYLCYRENILTYRDKLTAKSFEYQSSKERLVGTELNTLIGLMCKVELAPAIPSPTKVQELIDRTEALLKELHESMFSPLFLGYDKLKEIHDSGGSPFASGMAMREPIFYSGESAYDFQYTDLAPIKYQNDAKWIEENKGFSLADAQTIVRSLRDLRGEYFYAMREAMLQLPPEQWTILPAFLVSASEIADGTSVSVSVVENFIRAFSIRPGSAANSQFDTLNAYNQVNSNPFIDIGDGRFLLFQHRSLTESFYETPFYWMAGDKSYVDTATRNRGDFLEHYSADRLRSVFGANRVYEGVHIKGNGKNEIGEIDVLVTFADRAIVLQAKSKRLTIEARKGNDLKIKDDFKKAIQDAYDQGFLCASCLNKSELAFVDNTGQQLSLHNEFKEIYIFCVVSDHYPALGFQARNFLKWTESEAIKAPFVMDVFLLDVLCEMLPMPLYFLSYVNRRVGYADRILTTHELTVLSYHLKQNLWIDDEYNMLVLDDSVSAELDIAMMARRLGAPGEKTPEGIYTRLETSPVKRLIEQIENHEHRISMDLGFLVLSMSSDALDDLGNTMAMLSRKAKAQQNLHDLSIAIQDSGLTIHLTNDAAAISANRLRTHCIKRKYASKANSWFGICIDPEDSHLRFGVELLDPWEQSSELDTLTAGMDGGFKSLAEARAAKPRRKVGRNEPCPCGSGLKYKKCCLSKG